MSFVCNQSFETNEIKNSFELDEILSKYVSTQSCN